MPGLAPEHVKAPDLRTKPAVRSDYGTAAFTASLANCVHDTCQADILGKIRFKASGYLVKLDGFTVLYTEGKG